MMGRRAGIPVIAGGSPDRHVGADRGRAVHRFHRRGGPVRRPRESRDRPRVVGIRSPMRPKGASYSRLAQGVNPFVEGFPSLVRRSEGHATSGYHSRPCTASGHGPRCEMYCDRQDEAICHIRRAMDVTGPCWRFRIIFDHPSSVRLTHRPHAGHGLPQILFIGGADEPRTQPHIGIASLEEHQW